jgi:hypothetical protein
MGVAADAAFPVTALAVGAAAMVLALNLIGALPARAAGRLHASKALRAE